MAATGIKKANQAGNNQQRLDNFFNLRIIAAGKKSRYYKRRQNYNN